MDFISNRKAQNLQMLAALGIQDVAELFQAIPKDLVLSRPTYDDGISEGEALRYMEAISQKNRYPHRTSYLGAGAYEHHVPALVGAICSKSEFLTAYTPYQPEISQGMLQAIFEYQSAICALTGLEVANASVYDGASACAEAVLMALRHQPARHKVLIASGLHPHYRKVVEQYVGRLGVSVEQIPFTADLQIDIQRIKQSLDEKTATLLIQSPNFFGVLEPVREAFLLAEKVGAIRILCANPLSYGLFATAGELGADIAVGDSQPFGLPLQYGGPYVGYMATRMTLVRQLPGRIVGETVDAAGRRGFVLTLQAREQHIRREKATSNICTNQALAALASLVAILWYGPQGVRKLALTCYQRMQYLREQLQQIEGVQLLGKEPGFHECVVSFGRPLRKILRAFRAAGIIPGLDLGRYYPTLRDHLLLAVTETKSQQDLDTFVRIARQAMESV